LSKVAIVAKLGEKMDKFAFMGKSLHFLGFKLTLLAEYSPLQLRGQANRYKQATKIA